MLSPAFLKWIILILLILMAAPLLGALTANSGIASMTSIWIAVLVLLLVFAAATLNRFTSRVRRGPRDRAA
jgi:hypothetical protein